jgi:acyl-CoA hydrolase
MHMVEDVEHCVDEVIAAVGKRIRLATPLGLGKPIPLLNAFYRRAQKDPSIDLHIFTALTLERPKGKSELERRFLGPFVDRVFGDYPDLAYELDRGAGKLPRNVRVIEFYLYAGKYLGNRAAQRDVISTNYTFVARDLLERGVNVMAQAIASGTVDGEPAYSLSCNSDVSVDLLRAIEKRGKRHTCMVLGQVNAQLPFMYGDAQVAPAMFDIVVDDPKSYHRLFGTPKTAIADDEQLIGLYASTLVRDGGTLQIGIGSIGDALVYALKLRHEHNDVYRDVLHRLGVLERFGDVIARVGGTAPFEKGLFASTEMLVDGFMHLIEAGIVKRMAYDWEPLQRLLDAQVIDEHVTARTVEALARCGAIPSVLDATAIGMLKKVGVLKADAAVAVGTAVTAVAKEDLGETLQGGALVHAGFFLGPQAFYTWLRELPEERRRQISMRTIGRINDLSGEEALHRAQRRDARFINTTMMITTLGAAVSDALESGEIVSGVGGQYNFVAMAHALEDGRSVLQVRSTRIKSGGSVVSNIVPSYGHTTIARHLRDIVVTDHGIADLRAKTDGEVAEALIAVTDARFQDELAAQAKRAGKLDESYEVPELHRDNRPESYKAVLESFRERGFFPAYPFGSDLTEEERVLAKALGNLKGKVESMTGKLELLEGALDASAVPSAIAPYVERMGLSNPSSLKETLYQRLLIAELRQLGIGEESSQA